MKSLSILPVLLLSVACRGQFAVISDKDGYVNVRQDALKASAVIDSLRNGHLVYCFENKGNWTNIDYSKKTAYRNGYVYVDRYKVISSYPAIPVVGQTASSVRLSADSIDIIVTQKAFNKAGHTFGYFKDTPGIIELIDGKKYWGTDGGIPATEYAAITVKVGRKTINLPASAMQNLFEPNLYAAKVNFDKEGDVIYIQSMNGDGAGGYEVIWKIVNGVYKERFVAYGF